jgi:hypothetical protein
MINKIIDLQVYKNFYQIERRAKLEDKIIMFCVHSSLVCILMRISDKY